MTTPHLDDRRLASLIKTHGRDLEDVVVKTAHDVEAEAKSIVIRKDIIDTGATLNSIAVFPVPGDRFARHVGPTTDYSIHLEFGTRYIAARPFMTPAAESKRRSFADAMMAVYERASRG